MTKKRLSGPESKNTVNAHVPKRGPVKSGTIIAGNRNQMANLLDQKESQSLSECLSSYRTLFAQNENEQAMYHAMNHLCDMLEEDQELVELWKKAFGQAVRFDSFVDTFTSSTIDQFALQTLTAGGCQNLERWITSTERHLTEIMHDRGSTFAHLGNSTNVDRLMRNAKRDKNSVTLNELARHFRALINAKQWLNASREILAEREKRLRAKLRMTPHEPVNPAHRIAVPYYSHITLDQMQAYIRGDRSDYVFTVEKPIEAEVTSVSPEDSVRHLPRN